MGFWAKKAKVLQHLEGGFAAAFSARLSAALGLASATLLLSACLLDPDHGGSKVRPWDGTPGYLSLQVKLERNENQGLAKVSSADTTFGLDSMFIVLSAPGADTLTYRYAVQGRPDTGAIVISPKIYALNPLLTWKARIFTLDTTVSPVHRDTVHIDSVSFALFPADTAFVTKTVSATFSVIHARFASLTRDSLGAGIRYVRLRTVNSNGDTVTRDSVALYGGVFRGVAFGDLATGWVVQDSGRIFRSVDSGKTWFPQTSGTTRNLRTVHFANATTGWVAGDSGTIRATTNAGLSWTGQTSGTSRRLNRIHFISTTTGYAVGDSGTVLKTTDGGTTWSLKTGGWFPQTSGTSYGLSDVAFTSLVAGVAVGYNGVILSTLNGGGTWTTVSSPVVANLSGIHFSTSANGWAVGDSGKVVVTTNGGAAWAEQTSRTNKDLSGIFFKTSMAGWAAGKSETLLRTTDGGSTWLNRSSGWADQTSATTRDLKAVHFVSPSNGIAVGATGEIRLSANAGVSWGPITSPTGRNLNDVHFSGASDGWAVGDSETVARSTDGGVGWSIPSKSGWFSQANGVANVQLNAVHFTDAATGITVGAGGTIEKTTNNGSSWDAPVTGTGSTTLNDVHFSGTSAGWAVGDSETVMRTGNTGANWAPSKGGWYAQTSGTSANFNAVHFTAAGTGVAVGASGTIKKTTNFGNTWDATVTGNGSATLNDVHFSGTSAGYAVGDTEAVLRSTNGGSDWIAVPGGWASQSSGTSSALNAVHFTSTTTGWAVGAGGDIRKTANNGGTWTSQSANVTPSNTNALESVHAISTNNVVAVGDGETILRTLNGGTNWNYYPVGFIAKSSGITNTLNGVRFFDNTTGWAVADSGKILKTTDRGESWTQPWAATNKKPLRGVYAFSANHAVVVGDSGIIKRTSDGGANWTAISSGIGTPTDTVLRSVFFTGATGWAVGGTRGTVRFSNDSGKTWAAQAGAGGTLNAVFSNGTRVWMVGDNGAAYKVNAITNSTLSSNTNGTLAGKNLYGLYFTSNNVGYVVGAGGFIAKCQNTSNANWTTRNSGVATDLRHIYFKGSSGVNDTGYAIGDGGVVLRTHDSGFTWIKLQSGTTENLKALFLSATNRDTVYSVGANGKIIKTVTGGTWSGGGPRNLNDVYFYSAAGGFAVGDTGTILRTNNTAASWVPLNSGVTSRLNAVYSDGTRAWAVGDGGVVRHISAITTTSWTGLTTVTGTPNLFGVHFTSSTVGYVVGADGKIFKTTNNGSTWIQKGSGVTTDTLYSISFKGNGVADTGYVTGKNGTILRTLDSGATWVKLVSGTTEKLLGVQTGAGGSTDTTYAVGTTGTILKNVTRGLQWSGKVSKQAYRGVHLYSTTAGFAVGDSGSIIRTTNSGLNWLALTSGVTKRLNGVYSDGTRAWAVGDGGTVRHISAIATTSWSALTNSPPAGNDYYGVHFTSSTTGYVVGSGGAIYKTTDNGTTAWVQQGSGVTTDTLLSVSFRGAGTNDTGFAVGKNGTILRTVDGGTNWVKLMSGTTERLAGVFTNPAGTSVDTTYAVGTNGTILKTNSRGTQWSGLVSKQTLRGVHLYSATAGLAVGDSGTIIRSTNSGLTFGANASGVTSRLNAVYSDGTRAWAVGDLGVVRHTSTVATPSWSGLTTVTGSPRLLAVHFTSYTSASVARGYVAGADGKIFMTTDNGTTWTQQGSGVTSDTLYSLSFRGTGTNDTGYAVGKAGTILRTTNGGTTWIKLLSGTTANLAGVVTNVSGTSVDTTYAVGSDGTVLKTIARGGSWSKKVSPQVLRSVHLYSTTAGFAVGDSGISIRTTNAGANWLVSDSGFTARLNSVFSDGTRAWAVGMGGVVRYASAVTSVPWASATGTMPATVNLYGVHFTSSTQGYAVGFNTSGNLGVVYKTTNNGTNWSALTLGVSVTDTLRSVFFKGTGGAADTGYVTGDNGIILYTTNSGSNWTKHQIASTEDLAGVHAGVGGSMDTAFAVGTNGAVLKTYNAGALFSGAAARRDFLGVFYPTASIGYVFGTGGTILKTTNGGLGWVSQANPITATGNYLYGGHFFSPDTGWAVGSGGKIVKTTNGGTNWVEQTSGTTEFLYRVKFLNRDTGWVVGHATILKTTNGGANWVAQNANTTAYLSGLSLSNADSAVAVGFGEATGTIMKTRNGGAANIGPANLNGVYARNDSAYIVGNGATVYRSRDGGASWIALTGATQNLNGVFSTGNNTYIVGDGGQIVSISHVSTGTALTTRTSNTVQNLHGVWGAPTVGSTGIFAVGDSATIRLLTGSPSNPWVPITGSFSNPYYGVQCSGLASNCWIVGDNETVMKTTNASDWYLQTSGAKVFDQRLSYKYIKAGVANTVILQAIDRVSPLRGYQKTLTLTVGAGQDSTLSTQMTRCGYGGATPACTP